MTYMKSGQPFLYDDDTGDIVGFRNPDTGKNTDLVLPTRNTDGLIVGLSAGNGKAIIATTHEPPAGFSVPAVLAGIYAYRFGDKWHCNIGPDDLVDTSGITRTYYVDPVGGNNANSGLTWALRKKSIGNTMRAAETAGEPARILLYAANGPFWRQVSANDSSSNQTNAQTILLESICGRAQVGIFDNLTYTVDVTHTKTYTAARSLALRAINPSRLDANGLPTEYVTVASAAACNATAGTFYTDGTSVWVRPHGDEVPTLLNCQIIVSAPGFVWESNADLVMRNIDFVGGNTGAFRAISGSTNKIIADNCTFSYATSGAVDTYLDNVDIDACGLFAAFESRAYYGTKDGFNFHASGGVIPNALLVNCDGVHNGKTGSSSNNGFTCHDAVKAISIGCNWTGNHGTNSGHVNDGTQVWSVGDVAGSSAGDVVTGGSLTFAGFGAWSGAAELWLDSCRDIGADIGLYTSGGGAINTRNYKGSGQRTGDVSAY